MFLNRRKLINSLYTNLDRVTNLYTAVTKKSGGGVGGVFTLLQFLLCFYNFIPELLLEA